MTLHSSASRLVKLLYKGENAAQESSDDSGRGLALRRQFEKFFLTNVVMEVSSGEQA